MSDFIYAILRAGALKYYSAEGLTKRECVYIVFLYQKLGFKIHAVFTLASNGLRSSQVCSKLDECVNSAYFTVDASGHYHLTESGISYMDGMIASEEEWSILLEFEDWLSKASLDALHFQAVTYLMLTDSGLSADALDADKDKIKGILQTLVPNYSETALRQSINAMRRFHNKIKH